jgi:GDP-D-mannose dehydratase
MQRIVGAAKPDVLLHLAAQVAVTTSVTNPREDFEINALGTFNVLEAVRQTQPADLLHQRLHQQGLWQDGGGRRRRAQRSL